jgi:uncharacterized protein YdcH (DUF465 family)
MNIEQHSLSVEFPQFRDAIQSLRVSSAHFAKLFNEYNEADLAVCRSENGVEHLGDVALENLKKVRFTLKDQLMRLLQAHAKPA